MNAQQIILMLLAYPSSLPPSVQPITIYNRIPLIQHSQDWRGVGLSNILDCQTVPTFCNQHSENVHLSVSYFHFIIKRHSFFNYHRPRVFLQRIAVNHLYITSSICFNLGCFNACHLKMSFTISCDAISDRNWSFHFFILWIADDPVLYEAMFAFTTFKPNYFKFLWNHYTCFLLPAVPFLPILGSFKVIIIDLWAQ